ncbi:MAG: hypothetical protein NVS2B12_09200 [Ktedonobacteraceae bacterium]
MVETLLIGSVAGTCVIAMISILLFLKFQRQGMERLHLQQQAWERTQDIHKRKWEDVQEMRLSTIKQALLSHVENLYAEKQQKAKLEMTRVAYEIERLPRIEDTPIPSRDQVPKTPLRGPFFPRSFQGLDLSGRNLSSRFLSHADLRNTNLCRANLFMADLSGACLRGADLSEADLTATNLSNADLSGANLAGAVMLVTDFKNAILVGANLLGARQLTTEQIATAVVDSTTQFDNEIEITLPRIPRIPL